MCPNEPTRATYNIKIIFHMQQVWSAKNVGGWQPPLGSLRVNRFSSLYRGGGKYYRRFGFSVPSYFLKVLLNCRLEASKMLHAALGNFIFDPACTFRHAMVSTGFPQCSFPEDGLSQWPFPIISSNDEPRVVLRTHVEFLHGMSVKTHIMETITVYGASLVITRLLVTTLRSHNRYLIV